MSSTQVLYAYYEDTGSFEVPEGIDLRDTKHVCWYVRWNTLFIDTKDGRHFEIKGEEPQLKRPESCSLLVDDQEETIDFNDRFDDSSESEEESEESEEESESEKE